MGKRTRRIHVAGGRFDLREIAARIERLMKLRGKFPKAVYEEMRMKKADWSKKIHNAGSTFTVGELDAIATILDAPPGWPFLDDTTIAILERALAPPAVDRGAPPPNPAPNPPNPPSASDSSRRRRRGSGGL